MEFKQRDDGSLEVVIDDRRLARWFLGAALALIVLAVYHLLQGPNRTEQWIGSLAGAGLFLIAALAVFEHCVFAFDDRRRSIVWSRRTLFSRAKGELAFDAVSSVAAETSIDNDNAPTRRIVLKTEHGTIPFSRAYRGDPAGECVRIAARLNAFLGLSNGDEIADAAVRLARAGQEADALRLVGAEHGLSLAEARGALERLLREHEPR